MKVLWILPGSSDSKVNMVFARRMIPVLEKEGVEVSTYYLSSRTHLPTLIRSWREVRKLISTLNPDLIHSQYGSVNGLFASLLGRPYVITFRGTDINGDPALSRARGIFSYLCSQLAAARSEVSIFVSTYLAVRLVFPGRFTTVLPSPIDLDKFSPTPKKNARERLGLSTDKKIIAFINSGDRLVKRPELARMVGSRVAEMYPGVVEFLEIKNVDPELVPVYLSAADCLLFTSQREGSPNAIREALACGVPVVSVNVGDVKMWLEKDPASEVVYDDSVEALSASVKRVLETKFPEGRRADLGEYSLSAQTRKLLKIYRKTLKV